MRPDNGPPLYDEDGMRRNYIASRLKFDDIALGALDALGEGTLADDRSRDHVQACHTYPPPRDGPRA